MMRFSPNLKKALLIGTIILLGCDVSMLFAAPVDQLNAGNQTDPQLQQLQSQVQAQIKALNGNLPPTANAGAAQPGARPSLASSDAVGASLANNILNAQGAGSNVQQLAAAPPQQAQPNNLLPPSPFNDPTVPSSAPAGLPSQAAASLPSAAQQALLANAASPQGGPSGSNVVLPSQQAQADSGTSATPVSQSDVNDAAFNAMVQNTLPMSPDQIQKLRSMYMASQSAASTLPGTPPRPAATSVFVDLSPGSTPPVVRLAQGFVTSLVFVDSTGAPWPIESYDVGNPSAFNIQWDKTSNTLMVQATVLYTYGNIAVRLRGLDTPVMLTLIPSQKAVDYRVDMRIQGFGPKARPLIVDNLPASTSADLLNVLDGIPPPNNQMLKVEGGDCQAWTASGKMYVRTRLTILSPGWTATLSSADGMHAYEMQPSPMLLVSQNGEVIQLKVEGF